MFVAVNKDIRQERWKTVLFHSMFAIMLAMAYFFFKERLYADSAYYIFHSIDSGFFVTANQRIVLGISELISLAVFYCGGSLKVILVSWSLSHVVFYYLLFIIVYHVHRNESAGIAIILLQVIGQVWLYYSPMLEICYGAALLVVFSVLLEEKILTRGRWFWLIILEILVLTSHPENFVLFFFVVMADIIKNGFIKKVHLTFFVLLVACIVFKSLNWSEYEGGKLGYMLNPDQNHQYENLWNKNYMSAVLKIFTEHYRALIALLLLTTAAMIFRKKWKMLLLFYFCVGGLIVLINATNYANEFTRYNESLYYPLVSVITISFLNEFYLSLNEKTKHIIFLLLAAVSLFQLNVIRKNGMYLKLRTMQMETIMETSRNAGLKKSLVRQDNVEKERWACNWSYPMESVLISSINKSSETVSLIADEDYDYRDTTIALTPQRFILRRWEIRNDDNMLPFFKINNGNYSLLNNADSTITNDSLQGKVSLSIIPEKAVEAYSRIFIPVAITNTFSKKIYSLPIDQNYLLVKVVSKDETSSIEIPLDIDVSNQYTEIVSCPVTGISSPFQVFIKLMVNKKEVAAAETTVD